MVDAIGKQRVAEHEHQQGVVMKLWLCIAIFFLSLVGGAASAITAKLMPAHSDPCGGYSCSVANATNDL